MCSSFTVFHSLHFSWDSVLTLVLEGTCTVLEGAVRFFSIFFIWHSFFPNSVKGGAVR